MWQRNNGQGENNILQNQFTTYLVTALRWQKITYLRKRTKLGKHELPTDFDSAFAEMVAGREENLFSVEQPVLDSIALARALTLISDRERYVFFARTLEERGFGYKGAAAIYYRTIQKLRQEM